MKNTYFFFLSMFILTIFTSCKKENSMVPVTAKDEIELIKSIKLTNSQYMSIDSFFYNTDNLLSKKRKLEYVSNSLLVEQIEEYKYASDTVYCVIQRNQSNGANSTNRKYYLLNKHKLAYLYTDKTNIPLVTEFTYDHNNNLLFSIESESTYIFLRNISYSYENNVLKNKIYMTIAPQSNSYMTIYNYNPKIKNTITNLNVGQPYLGETERYVLISDTTYQLDKYNLNNTPSNITNYTYEFDSKNRITKIQYNNAIKHISYVN